MEKEGKRKMINKLNIKLILSITIICLILSNPLCLAISIHPLPSVKKENNKIGKLGDPVEIISYIRGKYSSIKILDTSLVITCKKGDIILRGIHVDDDFVGPFFEFYFNGQVSYIVVNDHSNFKGLYKNGYIRGRIIGDIITQ